MLLGGMTPGSLQPRLGREGLRHLVEAKARFFLPCKSRLSMWEQPPWSLPARARCHQPHSTWGGRGGAKGPPRGWVRLTPACTGRVCSSSHSKTGAAECLYSVGIIQPFAGMSQYIHICTITHPFSPPGCAAWGGMAEVPRVCIPRRLLVRTRLEAGSPEPQLQPGCPPAPAFCSPGPGASRERAEIRQETRVQGWGSEAGREGQRCPWVGKRQLSFQT